MTLPWSAARRNAVTGPAVDGGRRGPRRRRGGDGLAQRAGRRSGRARLAPGTASDELAGARILLADDNADMRAYLTRLLTGQGWRVRAVTDGRQALDEIHRDPPDLVLTDVMMPVLDGFDLVRRLRADPATRALPVLVLSARAGGRPAWRA
ncbi:response regulator [Micromonospora sp. M12]